MDSSCIIPEQESQEVFLSHAGKQKPFVIDLYNDLLKWPRCPPIKTFFDQSDESLPKGEEFPERIFEAAQKCTVAVVILTKEYVTSKWPMLELLAFVKAQETNPALKFLPVFYDGQPTSTIDDSWVEVWKAMESKSDGKSSDRITISVESCKEALRKLRKSNGLELTNNKSLQSLREEIVKEVVKFLPPSCELDTENVQGCLRLCKSIHKMFQPNKRGVSCLGLYGMGGLGKSTMCKEMCNYFGPSLFHRSCTLDIGSSEKGSIFKRHIKILESYKYYSKEQISKFDEYHAVKCVQRCLSDKEPKFLAVDNVQDDLDSRQEAEKYLEWLSAGSFIIITSRSQDILVSVNREIICKPFPNLRKEEAMTLFLRIAAPELARQPLNNHQNRIIEKCLQICFFSQRDHGDHAVNGEGGQYHPLALRAVASYLRENAEEDSVLCWKKVLKDKNFVFLENSKDNIYNILGLGFHNMCDLSKQLFIDVALFAPSSVGEIFKWLVSIHHGYTAQLIGEKLKGLRRKSFLNYDNKKTKTKSSQGDDEICRNISMHDLYREFAKRYITNENESQFKYGVYDDGTHSLPPPQLPMWARAPRIHLQRLPSAAKVKEWSNVAVVHLLKCETITTVSIGDLSSLRDLRIVDCPDLEVLSWAENIATKQPWGTQLCYVNLFWNRSLRKIPDFSCCSELQIMIVEGCSNAVEPIRLHTCSNLRLLHVSGNDVPEVQSIKSCPKLESVQLAWKSTHNGLPLLDDLHALSDLEIKGPSNAPFNQMDFAFLLEEKQFWKQLPKDSLCHTLPGAGILENLKNVALTSIPLGNLPEKLAAAGSSLQNLTLSGCLLSETVDFSTFPNLVKLIIRWTNVQEVCGLEHLKKLSYLDCSYCFRLQKVPDLRPLSELKVVLFFQCSMLHGIPRLPTGCIRDALSENEVRAAFASLAYAKTTPKALPLPGFGNNGGNGFSRIPSLVDAGWAVHVRWTCDGCMMFPIVGRRYEPKPVRTQYDLCSGCFSKKCYCTEKTNARWKAEGKLKMNYDLCSACYARSGCNLRDFYQIDVSLPDHDSLPRITVSEDKQSFSLSGFRSVVRSTQGRHYLGSVLSLKILSSPFTRLKKKEEYCLRRIRISSLKSSLF